MGVRGIITRGLTYYTHVGAMYSMISAMLMMFHTQRQEADDPARYDEICKKVDRLVTDLIAPMPSLPDNVYCALRYRPTGFVKDIAEALAKHLKPAAPEEREES